MGKSFRNEKTEAKIRSDVARAAKSHGGAGPHKDRRLPRGGAKNFSRDYLAEFEMDDELEEEDDEVS